MFQVIGTFTAAEDREKPDSRLLAAFAYRLAHLTLRETAGLTS
jgi:hypothetical protein